MLPFEEELNTVVDELSGTADAERAIAALGEGRFGDALLSGFLAIPFTKPLKAAKWVVKGVDRAGKGLAGSWRRLGPRAKRVWKKLSEERGSVGLPGAGGGRAGRSVGQDAGVWRTRRSSGTGAHEANMTRPKPRGTATHHIVPSGEYAKRAARDALHRAPAKLERLGIEPDDGANGAYSKLRDHQKIHTDEYLLAIDKRLRGARTVGRKGDSRQSPPADRSRPTLR